MAGGREEEKSEKERDVWWSEGGGEREKQRDGAWEDREEKME